MVLVRQSGLAGQPEIAGDEVLACPPFVQFAFLCFFSFLFSLFVVGAVPPCLSLLPTAWSSRLDCFEPSQGRCECVVFLLLV